MTSLATLSKELSSMYKEIQNIVINVKQPICRQDLILKFKSFSSTFNQYSIIFWRNKKNLESEISKLKNDATNSSNKSPMDYISLCSKLEKNNTDLFQVSNLNKDLINQLTALKKTHLIQTSHLVRDHEYELIEQSCEFKQEFSNLKNSHKSEIIKNSKSFLYCSICNKHFKSKNFFEAHPKTKIHLENLKTLYHNTFPEENTIKEKLTVTPKRGTKRKQKQIINQDKKKIHKSNKLSQLQKQIDDIEKIVKDHQKVNELTIKKYKIMRIEYIMLHIAGEKIMQDQNTINMSIQSNQKSMMNYQLAYLPDKYIIHKEEINRLNSERNQLKSILKNNISQQKEVYGQLTIHKNKYNNIISVINKYCDSIKELKALLKTVVDDDDDNPTMNGTQMQHKISSEQSPTNIKSSERNNSVVNKLFQNHKVMNMTENTKTMNVDGFSIDKIDEFVFISGS